MEEWIDVTDVSIEKSKRCYIRSSKIVEVRLNTTESGDYYKPKYVVELSEDSGCHFEFIFNTEKEALLKLKYFSEILGFPMESKTTSGKKSRQP